MCGRYFVDEDMWDKVRNDFPELTETNPFRRSGDITPAMGAASLTQGDEGVQVSSLIWGFPGFDKKLIINARAEGIEDKPTFAESIQQRRCVLPASGFYEWNRHKEKVTFTDPDVPVIYLAGIFRPYGDEDRFVIITREANESMLPVHDRMPLMIKADQVRDWIHDPAATEEFLHQALPQLEGKRDYEQLTLF